MHESRRSFGLVRLAHNVREEVVVDRRLGQRLIVGAAAGAVGTAAMDLLLYRRYRRAGGDDSVWSWESAAGVTSWQQASAPGQIGRKLQRLLTRREPADRWARATTNTVHWATGIGWGIQYGAVIGLTSTSTVAHGGGTRAGRLAGGLRGAAARRCLQADLELRRPHLDRRSVGAPGLRRGDECSLRRAVASASTRMKG